jgi:hypothetical protein
MTEQSVVEFVVDPLPERARLFHLGPYKTGTTALQAAASSIRPELLSHGVRYPGNHLNQRLAVAALGGHELGWKQNESSAGGRPRARYWTEIRREIEAEKDRRIWFGHEHASAFDDRQVARVVAATGASAHYVITLRPFATVLTSLWQESLKRNAGRQHFESWLADVLQPQALGDPKRRVRHDHAALVERWTRIAGPERVTVVALDPNDHSYLFRSFEQLLALPDGLVVAAAARAAAATVNRSFTVSEAELFRQLNQLTRRSGLEWENHEWLMYHGAIPSVIARPVSPDEARLQLPGWARELAAAQEEIIVDALAASGARLIGSSDHLRSRPDGAQYLDPSTVTTIPIDAAVEALLGALAVATGRQANFLPGAWAVRRKLRSEIRVNLPRILRSMARGWR